MRESLCCFAGVKNYNQLFRNMKKKTFLFQWRKQQRENKRKNNQWMERMKPIKEPNHTPPFLLSYFVSFSLMVDGVGWMTQTLPFSLPFLNEASLLFELNEERGREWKSRCVVALRGIDFINSQYSPFNGCFWLKRERDERQLSPFKQNNSFHSTIF